MAAISSRLGSGATLAASSRHSSSGGSIGWPVAAERVNAVATTSAISAVNSPRSRRWSCAGAVRYSVLRPASSQSASIAPAVAVAAAIRGSCQASSAVAAVCSTDERKRSSASHTDSSASSAGAGAGEP